MLHGGEIYSGKPVVYDFSVNISPLGIPGQVLAALRELSEDSRLLTQYPDQECRALRGALARSTGIPEAQILCGNGASELIEAAVRALRPRDILLTAPSFSGYRHAAEGSGARIHYHRLCREENFALTERYLEDLENLRDLENLEHCPEQTHRSDPSQRPDQICLPGQRPDQICLPGQRPDQICIPGQMRIQETAGGPEMPCRPDMAILCSPSNPVGDLIDPRLLDRIVEKCERQGTWLLIDECFLGLTTEEGTRTMRRKLAEGAQHLLVLDSFTKRYAMPGIRLGYLMVPGGGIIAGNESNETVDSAGNKNETGSGIGNENRDENTTRNASDNRKENGTVIENRNAAGVPILEKIRAQLPEWSVSVPAQTAGRAALEADADRSYSARAAALVRTERARMETALRELGFRVFPGTANYIFFSAERDIFDALLDRGFLIRDCQNYEGLKAGDHRIAVLAPEENTLILQALEEICAETERSGR